MDQNITKAYSVSVEYYKNIETDDRETVGKEFIVFAKSYTHAEAKIFKEIDPIYIYKIWSMNEMDAVPVA